MRAVATKARLSAPRRRLLELMQRLNFGRIEQLTIRGGEPMFDPPPRVVEEIKFGGEHGPRSELGFRDFALKTQVQDLFEQLGRLGDGRVESLEVQHGLPFRMKVEGTVSA